MEASLAKVARFRVEIAISRWRAQLDRVGTLCQRLTTKFFLRLLSAIFASQGCYKSVDEGRVACHGWNRVRRIKYGLRRRGAGSGLSLGKWGCAARGFSKFNETSPLSSIYPPLSSLFLSHFLQLPFSLIHHPPLSRSTRKNREKERKKGGYYALAHPVTCLFDATKLDPFLVGEEYTYSC